MSEGKDPSPDLSAIAAKLEQQEQILKDLRADVRLLKSRGWYEEVRAMMGTWALIITSAFFLWVFFFIMMDMESSIQLIGVIALSVLWFATVMVALHSFGKR